jgi:hypothetical protein
MAGRVQAASAAAIVLLATIPFLLKPLHIDDPADLQYVQQVLRRPSDPYGFEVDWDEGPRWAFRNYHPPLKYYYHALVLRFFPLSELTLHASYLPFVAMTAWGVIVIARRFGCSPLLVLILWMLGPGYLPGQNAMLDVPAMALGLAGTALFIGAVDRNRTTPLFISAFLLGSALLTKYSAIVYIPVWIGYLMCYGRARHWLSLVVPAVMFAVWCAVSVTIYGEVHARVLFTRVPGHVPFLAVQERVSSAAVFLGGAMPAAAVLLAAQKRAGGVVLLSALCGAGLAGWLFSPTRRVVNESPDLSAVNLAWWAFLAFTGLGVILFAVYRTTLGVWQGDKSTRRDELFLNYWFLIALGIGVVASPFMAMRRVLEASLPALMLLARRDITASWSGWLAGTLAVIVNTLMGYMVAAADYEFAAVYPRFARDLAETAGSGSTRVWCHGYWGWYYYTRLNQLPQYVIGRDEPPSKSLLIIPGEVAKPAVMPESVRIRARRVGRQDVFGFLPIRLMSYQAGAGYYGDSWGPLPYAWSVLPWEVFSYFELNDAELSDAGGERH